MTDVSPKSLAFKLDSCDPVIGTFQSVFNIVAYASNIEDALKRAYDRIAGIQFEDKVFRHQYVYLLVCWVRVYERLGPICANFNLSYLSPIVFLSAL